MTLMIAAGGVGLAEGMAYVAPDLARIGIERMERLLNKVDTDVQYVAASRAVSNWRREAAADLVPGSAAAVAALVDEDQPAVARCVKLNNYWCIKSARWNGELGSDDEGHVGFASAEHGADAAANLLRRYYLEFSRKSALDIVRRWAPAECNLAGGSAGVAALAVKGIGNTLRARYLASRRKVKVASAGAARPAAPRAPRVSAVPSRPLPSFHVPDIAAGMGERKVATVSQSLSFRVGAPKPAAPRKVAQPAATGSTEAAAKPPPRIACAPDEQRIRNYAGQIVQGLGLGPTDDLDLFEPDGTPRPNLAQVMLAMSAVELGTMRASPDLVSGAVERAALRAEDRSGPESEQAGRPTDKER